MRVTLTERGKEKLAEELNTVPPPDIRIYQTVSGCGGQTLSMTTEGNPAIPDATKGLDGAERFETNGFVFFVDKSLLGCTGDISIDFTKGVFNLVSKMGHSCIDGCGDCGKNLVLPKRTT